MEIFIVIIKGLIAVITGVILALFAFADIIHDYCKKEVDEIAPKQDK